MSLLDTARGINSEDERRKRTENERARMASLFEEQKDRWLEELSQAMTGLCAEFNSVVRNEAMRLKAERLPATKDKIRIVSLGPEAKVCEITASPQNPRIVCSFITPRGTKEEHFEALPSKAKGIQVRIFKSRSRTIWAEEEGRKSTGDLFQDLRTITERYPETVGVDEFADFLLNMFVTRFVRC
jgi:hypothetical protein